MWWSSPFGRMRSFVSEKAPDFVENLLHLATLQENSCIYPVDMFQHFPVVVSHPSEDHYTYQLQESSYSYRDQLGANWHESIVARLAD
jgi:hypothetical protein